MRRLFTLALLGLTACRSAPTSTPTATPTASAGPPAQATAAPAPQALPLQPLDAASAASASAVALAHLGERTLAFIADADDQAVVTFDVDSHTRLASTPLGARPSAVLVTPAGRVVALGADDAHVHLLIMTAIDAPLVAERTVAVPDEPVSAALTPAGDTLLVASRWGHALSIVGLASTEAPVFVDLPRDPTAVIASSDGRRAIVLHAAGSRASHVDLASRDLRVATLDRRIPHPEHAWTPMAVAPDDLEFGTRPRKRMLDTLRAGQTFAAVRLDDGGVIAPSAAVSTGLVASSGGYGSSEVPATPAIVTFDASWAGETSPGGKRLFGSRCLLPRAAALDSANHRLLVACLGSDEMAIVRLRPEGAQVGLTIRVAKGPLGLAVDGAARRAVVWSAFERVVSVVALERVPRVTAKTVLAPTTSAVDAAVMRGRALFNATFDDRVSSDGRACASCHPDGRDDGLTWSAPGGLRQTPMLVERLEGTAPYGWDGSAPDLVHHLAHTTDRLGGRGLRPSEVADLAAYLATLHPPAPPSPVADRVRRGAALFASAETQCASCHTAGGTDGEGHDLDPEAHRGAPRKLDTPSLHLVAHSAPYFHDGRYVTLGDLLAGVDGTMGHTAQLSPDDRGALEAYLETL